MIDAGTICKDEIGTNFLTEEWVKYLPLALWADPVSVRRLLDIQHLGYFMVGIACSRSILRWSHGVLLIEKVKSRRGKI